MSEVTLSFTTYERDDGIIEYMLEDSVVTKNLERDWDRHIDQVNEVVMKQLNIDIDQIDWRDPNTLWVHPIGNWERALKTGVSVVQDT
jgi:hypothetical protein